MKQILNRLINHENISTEEAKQVLINISNGAYHDNQIASFLTVYMMRNITVEELKGFRDALLELCIPVSLTDFNTIDLCGTGGDSKNTFNISTLSSFVVAGADYKVAKHGNYGVSSVSGSSNVMEFLGVKFTNNQDILKRQVEQAGICFLHAALFHPAMKKVAPIRRSLGVKTFFNMLGPMVNPSRPKNQLVGVFDLSLLRLYHYLYQGSDIQYNIVHNLDGYDEVSLTAEFKIANPKNEAILNPENIGLKKIQPEDIYGGNSIEESAKIFMEVLNGNGTEAQKNVVYTNSAFAIATIGKKPFEEAFEEAKVSLDSGKALASLKKLLSLNPS